MEAREQSRQGTLSAVQTLCGCARCECLPVVVWACVWAGVVVAGGGVVGDQLFEV